MFRLSLGCELGMFLRGLHDNYVFCISFQIDFYSLKFLNNPSKKKKNS